jgi:DNA-binding transcriptional ArsR family regulator
MASQTELTIDDRIIKAVAHPLRQQILHALNTGVASPAQLADQLGERLNNVSYHVKILEKYGAVELVSTAPVRGALEHFYRATARPFIDDDHWAQIPLATRRALFDHILQQIWDHVSDASQDGGFDDERTHISWTTLELDDQAYEELAGELGSLLTRAMELESEAKVRMAASAEEPVHRTELDILHFRRSGDAD